MVPRGSLKSALCQKANAKEGESGKVKGFAEVYVGNRKVVMLERSEASIEFLDFGPSGRLLLIHFV